MVPSGQSEVPIEEQAGFGRTARFFIAERFERRNLRGCLLTDLVVFTCKSQ